jgi:hypothetical protein
LLFIYIVIKKSSVLFHFWDFFHVDCFSFVVSLETSATNVMYIYNRLEMNGYEYIKMEVLVVLVRQHFGDDRVDSIVRYELDHQH